MSVADVLQKIGDWTQGKELAKIVAKEYDIAEETAYRRMTKETSEKLIRRIPLADRRVIYGLPNWKLKENDVKILIDAMNAVSLSTLANARHLEALAKFIEATKDKKNVVNLK